MLETIQVLSWNLPTVYAWKSKQSAEVFIHYSFQCPMNEVKVGKLPSYLAICNFISNLLKGLKNMMVSCSQLSKKPPYFCHLEVILKWNSVLLYIFIPPIFLDLCSGCCCSCNSVYLLLLKVCSFKFCIFFLNDFLFLKFISTNFFILLNGCPLVTLDWPQLIYRMQFFWVWL